MKRAGKFSECCVRRHRQLQATRDARKHFEFRVSVGPGNPGGRTIGGARFVRGLSRSDLQNLVAEAAGLSSGGKRGRPGGRPGKAFTGRARESSAGPGWRLTATGCRAVCWTCRACRRAEASSRSASTMVPIPALSESVSFETNSDCVSSDSVPSRRPPRRRSPPGSSFRCCRALLPRRYRADVDVVETEQAAGGRPSSVPDGGKRHVGGRVVVDD